jgi:sulfate adenylyltransferase (ADP) / ATP adenylyltransferase
MKPLASGTLWDEVRRATRRGLDSGSLWSIPTTAEVIEDGGVAFGIRVVDNLRRKGRARWQAATDAGGRPDNPFLPHDEDLYVGHVGDTHVCLLNKFNVLDHHLLIVTAGFEDQRTLLTRADLGALWHCMAEVDGLGFYNGGVEAGASQPHKHLQLAPFPLVPGGRTGTPVDAVLEDACTTGGIGRSPSLPFAHAAVRLDDLPGDPGAASHALRERYLELLDQVDLAPDRTAPLPLQAGPYNLLLTRRWMLAVPRAEEFFETLSLNALAFAGGLLVKDEVELARVREVGPMALLRHCGVTRRGPAPASTRHL